MYAENLDNTVLILFESMIFLKNLKAIQKLVILFNRILIRV